ncbi:MAG: hypothetical protein ACRYF2_23280 [Janthinobacterium lividum]
MNDEKPLKIWTVYRSAWAPINVEERREMLDQSVAANIVYTDPGSQVHEMEALTERIDQSQGRLTFIAAARQRLKVPEPGWPTVY